MSDEEIYSDDILSENQQNESISEENSENIQEDNQILSENELEQNGDYLQQFIETNELYEDLNQDNFFEIMFLQNQEEENEEDNGLENIQLLQKVKNQLDGIQIINNPEKLEYIKSDAPEFKNLLTEQQKNIKELRKKIEPLLKLLTDKSYQIADGLSYLDVKFNLILSYCINITFYMLLKVRGLSIQNHPVIKRLIYIKTILGKLKPIDKKLEYQITKLLKLAAQSQENPQLTNQRADPLTLKPKPQQMAEEQTTERLEIDDEGQVVESKKKKNIYIPPKLSAVLSKDDRAQKKQQRQEEFKKRKFLRSELYKDLQEEFSERPQEINLKTNLGNIYDEEEEKRRKFEEANFTRLAVTKKDKERRKRKLQEAQREENDFESYKNVTKYLDLESGNQKTENSNEKLKKTFGNFLKKSQKTETKRKNDQENSGKNEINKIQKTSGHITKPNKSKLKNKKSKRKIFKNKRKKPADL